MSTRRFFALPEFIVDGRAFLSADETRHLRDVLRLKTGDAVRVFDGLGNEYEAEIAGIGKHETTLLLRGTSAAHSPESPLELTLGVGLLKGEKFDLVVQKCVELGVTRLVPLLTARADVKLKGGPGRAGRWRKIALEATKQCGRARLMEVPEPVEFTAWLASQPPAEGSLRLFFSERGGSGLPSGNEDRRITAVVGPEGGWDDSEIEGAREHGCSIVTLGGRILRAETAALSIAAILQHRFGDVG